MFLAQWSEEVALGNKDAFDSISGIQHKIVHVLKTGQGNSQANTETKETYEP